MVHDLADVLEGLTVDEKEQQASQGEGDDGNDDGGDGEDNCDDEDHQLDDNGDHWQGMEEEEQEESDHEPTNGDEDQASVPLIPVSEATSQLGINMATAMFFKEFVVKENLSVRMANKLLKFFQQYDAKDVSRRNCACRRAKLPGC